MVPWATMHRPTHFSLAFLFICFLQLDFVFANPFGQFVGRYSIDQIASATPDGSMTGVKILEIVALKDQSFTFVFFDESNRELKNRRFNISNLNESEGPYSISERVTGSPSTAEYVRDSTGPGSSSRELIKMQTNDGTISFHRILSVNHPVRGGLLQCDLMLRRIVSHR